LDQGDVELAAPPATVEPALPLANAGVALVDGNGGNWGAGDLASADDSGFLLLAVLHQSQRGHCMPLWHPLTAVIISPTIDQRRIDVRMFSASFVRTNL
jgi:hypothetical protein